MILERGRVESLDGPAAAWVQCNSRIACQRCASGQGCGGGLLGSLLGDRLHRIRVERRGFELQPGDQVELGIREIGLVWAAAIAYLLPLAGLLIGAVAAGAAAGFDSDGYTLVGGLAGLLLAIAVSRRLSVRAGSKLDVAPQIVRIIGPCSALHGDSGSSVVPSV